MRAILHTRLRDKQGHTAGLCTYPLKGCRTSLLSQVWVRSWRFGGGFLSLQHEGTGFNRNQGRCWTLSHFCLKTTTTAPTSHLKISRLVLGVNCSFGFDIFSWRISPGQKEGNVRIPEEVWIVLIYSYVTWNNSFQVQQIYKHAFVKSQWLDDLGMDLKVINCWLKMSNPVLLLSNNNRKNV